MVGENKVYWGMHFCNSRMFKTVTKVEMYIQEQKTEGINLPLHVEEHTQYYMTEQGQIFKLDKTKFDSYELDLQKMVWFHNRDFMTVYFGDYIKYTELNDFVDCFKYR